MPYSTVSELPDNVKGLPAHAKEIYMKAFNSAFKQYDGDEAKSHGTAWAAVKMKFKKGAGGKWVAKEAKKLSDKNKSSLLQAALASEYKMGQSMPIPQKLIVSEVFDDKVVYDVDGQLYEAQYEMDKEGKVIIGEPKKVLGTQVYSTMESLSMENRRTLLDAALTKHLSLGKEEHLWVEDLTETEVFYNHDHQSYKANYTIAEDGIVTFGDPKKVTRQIVYKAMESLQSAYSEIIHEAGRRNATLDSSRIKKIVELCQELLSSEITPDEDKAKEALVEANSVLKWILEQAAMKTEDGVKYPAAAYAYVPDKEKSSTWKLRLWESLDKKVTRTQLGRAAAALSPGGFRGQKVQIPVTELSAVKRKIRSEYRKLDVEDDDIPRWVKDAETREEIRNFVSLAEAKFDKGRAAVIVIKPGFNEDKSRYYPADMLKRDYGIFEGEKMYADHPTEQEDKDRPERSIRDWVATLSEVSCDEAGVVTGIAEILEPWLMQKLAALRDKKMLSEMGISINAIGSGTEAVIEGTKTTVIEKLVAARSVDFVTEPGAGGVVTFYESDRRRDVDLVDLATLKEKRPDLVKVIEADVRAKITTEVKKAMEDKEKIVELEGQIETLTGERDTLKTKVTEGEKEKAKADAKAVIEKAVADAELPKAAKERLVEHFKDAESADGIEEAIKSEVEYIGKLAEAGKVKGLGGTKPDTKKDHESLVEAFKGMGMSDDEAKIAATGR